MTSRIQVPPPPRVRTEGNLCDIGAVLCAIVRLTSDNGGLEEEDTRAIYSLACIALAEWRMLDEAEGGLRIKP